MPSVAEHLQRLLCHCYADKAVPTHTTEFDAQGMDCYQPGSRQPPAPSITIPSAPGPRPPLRTTPHSAPSPSRTSPPAQTRTESDSQPIYHSPTSSPRQSMMLTTCNNPYNSNSSHLHIEDVTDDPQYSSYDQPQRDSDEEGAFLEYCRLDKVAPAPKDQFRLSTILTQSTLPDFTAKKPTVMSSTLHTSKSSSISIPEPVFRHCTVSGCSCSAYHPHDWRKVCVHCRCDRNEHEATANQTGSVYERLGIKPPASMPISTAANLKDAPGSVSHGYSWVPPGLNRKKVEEYMAQLPNHVVPRTNSAGEKYREKQLVMQLPRQDLSPAYCRHLGGAPERKVYEEFVNARNEIALDIGYVNPNIPNSIECHKCRGILERNEMAVIAPKLGESTGWHPPCFACNVCDQLLVDLTYCVKEGQVYCERHYAELHKPRCSACDELIFSGEYTKAMNKDWHSAHFCCWNCDKSLTGQRYIMREDQPYCIKCYEDVFANQCDECAKPIGIDSKDLSYKDKHWHESCFICNMCKISLVDQPFGSKNDRIFCSNCYDQAFATRCDGCGEIFRAGMKKMEYKGKQWHDKCFCCATCKNPIGTKSFIPKNEEVYCAQCYEEKFATRCSKCKKVVTTGGVTYKNEPYHRECFVCTHCNTSLAGQRFTSKDEKPYCANCYGEMFAKRCSACTKPITGIGGAKFISFEDRNWHNDCFICAQCSTSLIGKGFITDGTEVICPECAKARLMAANC